MMQVTRWKTDCMNAWFATEVCRPLSSLLSPGVDHDVLSDLWVSSIGRDVQSWPAVSVAEVGVRPEPDHQPHDVQTAAQSSHLNRSVALFVEKVDIYLVVVTTENILQFTVITIPESWVKSWLGELVEVLDVGWPGKGPVGFWSDWKERQEFLLVDIVESELINN